MSNASERFPRAKLFGYAAELQSMVEYWLAITLQKQQEAEDLGLGNVQSKFLERYRKLDLARELVTEARRHLYDCP
jgi:hypothetical protein